MKGLVGKCSFVYNGLKRQQVKRHKYGQTFESLVTNEDKGKRMGAKAVNTSKDTDTAIAYQNKDIVSKFFGDRMKGKALSLFHLKSDLKVVDVRPTNIPIFRSIGSKLGRRKPVRWHKV